MQESVGSTYGREVEHPQIVAAAPAPRRTVGLRSISGRLNLAFLLTFLAFALLAAAVYSVQRGLADLYAAQPTSAFIQQAVRDLEINHLRHEVALRDYLSSGDPEQINRVHTAGERFRDLLARVQRSMHDDVALRLLHDEVQAAHRHWSDDVMQPVVQLVANGDSRTAQAMLWSARGRERRAALNQSVQSLDLAVRQIAARRAENVQALIDDGTRLALAAIFAGLLVSLFAIAWVLRSVGLPLAALGARMRALAVGRLEAQVPHAGRDDEIGDLARALETLRAAVAVEQRRLWVRTQAATLSEQMQQAAEPGELGRTLLTGLAPLIGAACATLHVRSSRDGRLESVADYGLAPAGNVATRVAPGEGLLGEAARARELRMFSNVPPGYLRVESGLGAGEPAHVLLAPVWEGGENLGVLEIAAFEAFERPHVELIEQLRPLIGLSIAKLQRAEHSEMLIDESRAQARELVASEEALRQKAVELEAANRYKSEFLATMSHELRTPLNSLLILTTELTQQPRQALHPEDAASLRVVHEAGTHVLALINDVLDLSRIEAKRVAVNPRRVDVAELLDRLQRSFRPLAAQRELVLEVSREPGCPELLHTDAVKLEQILRNLIGNALKFTAAGGVRVCVGPAAPAALPADLAQAGRPYLQWRVEDDGIGIPPEEHERIFESFEQVETGATRRYGGAGLGLAISRELADLLGGWLTVQSAPGKGSIFSLFLPQPQTALLEQAPDRPAVEASPPSVPTRQSPLPLSDVPVEGAVANRELATRTLLVVDDDMRNTFALGQALRARGARALLAQDGHKALQLLAEHVDIDLVILDLMMPGLDGRAVLRRMGADERLAAVPVIVASADIAHGDPVPGARAQIGKPIDIDRLVAMIGEQLPEPGAGSQTPEPARSAL